MDNSSIYEVNCTPKTRSIIVFQHLVIELLLLLLLLLVLHHPGCFYCDTLPRSPAN
jgi:hypothetical protein